MNTNFNSEDNFNELVFENKNKAYGAYAIRKSYNNNVSNSVLLTSMFFGLLSLLAVYLTTREIIVPVLSGGNDPAPFVTTLYELPKPEKPIVEKIEKPESAPKTSSGQMIASDDKKNLVDKTNAEIIINKNPNPFGNDSAAPKDPEIKVPEKIAPLPEVVKYVDKMPRLENMAQFIADHLKYPQQAIANGTAGIVYVTFVVERDGSITDIKLLQGIGDGCEQEAMRVVGIMPLWEPGTHKDIPQRVQCNLPIKFRIK